ncbi:MAG TPA: Gfo/Idh/MocA family oxidoreductase [Chthonomonadales bacterium]|nr:Gfo/Idh/MocA family oxidoreductase [Chthonomonadales bacterium]
MEKLRFGVIGTGGMGTAHCANFEKIEEAVLTAVCDIDAGVVQAAAERFGVPGFGAAEELLDSGLVDAVLIATPHYSHPPIAIEAFRRKIHVLSEKPIAVTVSQADSMIAAALESGCAFGVMYQFRSAGVWRQARRIVEEGRLGEVYRTMLVMGWYRSQAYYDSGGWRATWTGEGGGVLINQAPHFLDAFAWLGGLPTRLTGGTRTRLHEIEVEDEAFATLEYANGAHGYLYASTTEAPASEVLEVCGDRGKLELRGGQLRVWDLSTSIRAHCRESTAMWGDPESVAWALERPGGGGQHREITANFCRHITSGEPLMAPGAEGLWAVELINGLILAGHTGDTVELPVDRSVYDRLLAELQAGSREKSRVREQRVTDPQHL